MRRRTLAAIALGPVLLLVALWVAPLAAQAGGGCHVPGPGSVYTEGSTTVIRMDVCSFAPTIARVPVGTAVRFLNSSTIEHAVVGRSGTWASDIVRPGAEFSTTFAAAGTYPYSCPLHPGMVGAIAVDDGPGAGAVLPTGAALAAGVEQPTAGTDWTRIGIVGLAGLGAGAIIGVLAGATLAGRRRAAAPSTTD